MNEKVLEVRDLHTRFFTHEGMVNAVDGLSLQVESGEVVGIVGESGCGKSTAALSFMRLLPPQGKITDGEVILCGQEIVSLPDEQMRLLRGPKIAMVFQDSLAALDPTMKVGDQLIEPLQLHMKLSKAEARQSAIQLLSKVGIPAPEKRLDAYPHQFSGGMRQRVMIAIALSCNPRLLIADEPTTALDVTVQKQILDLMLRLRDELQAGIILITHDVGVVSEVCDRVVVMYAGREVESGATRDVFVSPRHPYTKGLLSSSLSLGHDRRQALRTIPGLPPNLIQLPPGCPFMPRCPLALGRCQVEPPPLKEVRDGHFAACWNMEE